jgi:membrane-associated protease RseP (regulator of RpoE activity)
MRKAISIPVLILLLAACVGRAEEEATQQPAAPSAVTSSTTPVAAPTSVVVRNADGSELMTIRETDKVVEISLTEAGQKRELRGEPRDSGKRKYSVGGGAVAYEVKPGDTGGFKLRTFDGSLLWKVKITPEKIKISNNEQNDNPFELKVREGDRVKVVAPGDRELGNVRFDRAKGKTEIENAASKTLFTVDGATPSGAYGVLLLDTIPVTERAILVAEILSRGR